MEEIRSFNPTFSNNDDKANEFKSRLYAIKAKYRKENGSIKGGVKLLIKAIIILILYFVPFVILLMVSPVGWIAVCLLILICFGMVGVGLSIMHDAAHDAFSKKQWLNWLMKRTIYLLGSSLMNWLIQHNLLHHTYTNIEGLDEDTRSRLLFRFSKHSPYNKRYRYQHIYAPFFYSFYSLAKFIGDFPSLFHYAKLPLPAEYKFNLREECLRAISYKLIYLFIAIGLPILLTDYTWWQVLLGFISVHMVSSVLVAFIFQCAHVVEGVEQFPEVKTKKIDASFFVHELKTTSNFLSNWFFSELSGGLGYQIEHHLLPDVSHIHYRKFSREVKKLAEEFDYPYHVQPSFLKSIISHLKKLKLLGAKP